ncbi:MAG TPA: hypothetical protein VII46_09740 [Acidimicrobiales bacterium]
MPKRTFWLVTGAALGAGSSLWAERRVRRTVAQATARLQPDALVVEVGRSARQVAGSAGGRVRDAVVSGRDEMLRREEELWADLATPGAGTDVGGRMAAGVPASRTDLAGASAHDGPLARRRRRASAKSPSHLGQ